MQEGKSETNEEPTICKPQAENMWVKFYWSHRASVQKELLTYAADVFYTYILYTTKSSSMTLNSSGVEHPKFIMGDIS